MPLLLLNRGSKMGFVRKHLSADGLHQIVRHSFDREKLPSYPKSTISWQDCTMSGLAVFGLKFPSLLQFENEKWDAVIKRNLTTLYRIKNVPSDTCMRERLDMLLPRQFRRAFKTIFAYLQRGKQLERFKFLNSHYLLSIDGTGHFSSDTIHCKNCCIKKHRDGSETYYHQMRGAAIVNPDEKVVIPLAPEPIVKGDGDQKNDCERNACKRLLNDLRREHPHLKLIIVEDGLASNYPHLSLLDSLKMKYVIGVKQGDHDYLFDWIKHAKANEFELTKNKINHKFRFVNQVPLNDEHHEYLVNVLEHWEENAKGEKQYFSWVTNVEITQDNAFELMRAGRARWRIENETFNTLKNLGYNFGHNYGHGNENLCTNFSMLMLLAFLIDQVQWLCCKQYQKVKIKKRTWHLVFEYIRSLFRLFCLNSWSQVYDLIIAPEAQPPPSWF